MAAFAPVEDDEDCENEGDERVKKVPGCWFAKFLGTGVAKLYKDWFSLFLPKCLLFINNLRAFQGLRPRIRSLYSLFRVSIPSLCDSMKGGESDSVWE